MPILLIRHGNTTWDDKVDALMDPPLDRDGIERIERTIDFLYQKDFKITRIVSSPLQRALKVALLLADGNIRVTTNIALKPWNLGDLMGKKTYLVKDQIERLEAYPNLKAPHGETYRAFYDRWTEFLKKVMEYAKEHHGEYIVLTTHSRNINAMRNFIDDDPVGDVKEATPEGSVTVLALTGSGNWKYELIWEGK